MLGLPTRSKARKCSFCGKTEHQVRRLIAGPKVTICDDCVRSCVKILAASEAETGEATAAPIGDGQLLDSLRISERAVDAARDVLDERVRQLRQRGVSWEAIGKALGVSRQAAWERFS